MHVVWIPNTLVMLFILNNRTHQLIFFLVLNERFFSNAVDKLFEAIVLHSLNIVKSNRFNFRTTLTDSKMWEKKLNSLYFWQFTCTDTRSSKLKIRHSFYYIKQTFISDCSVPTSIGSVKKAHVRYFKVFLFTIVICLAMRWNKTLRWQSRNCF